MPVVRRDSGFLILMQLERFHVVCSELGAMPTLAVGMFPREKSGMATNAWP